MFLVVLLGVGCNSGADWLAGYPGVDDSCRDTILWSLSLQFCARNKSESHKKCVFRLGGIEHVLILLSQPNFFLLLFLPLYQPEFNINHQRVGIDVIKLRVLVLFNSAKVKEKSKVILQLHDNSQYSGHIPCHSLL